MAAGQKKITYNDPVSHVPKSQGGRTFARAKPHAKLDPRTSPNNEAHKRNMRQKIQLKPTGNARFPHGKYYKMLPNGEQDPTQKEAFREMTIAASKRERS